MLYRAWGRRVVRRWLHSSSGLQRIALARMRWVALAVYLAITVGCGGSDSDSDDGPIGFVRIEIDSPDDGAKIASNLVSVSGTTDCPNCPPPVADVGRCPAISCPATNEVDVTWRNDTTGSTDRAFQFIFPSCGCLFSSCSSFCITNWQADVPLEFGLNSITVVATDTTGATGTAEITIERIP